MIRFLELPILAFDESVAEINASNIPINIPEIDETVVKKHIILTEEMCQNVALVLATYPISAKTRKIHYEDICEITFHNVYQTGIVIKTIGNIPMKARDVMNLINSKLKEWMEEDIAEMEKEFENEVLFRQEMEEFERKENRAKKKKLKNQPLQLPPSNNPNNPNIIN